MNELTVGHWTDKGDGLEAFVEVPFDEENARILVFPSVAANVEKNVSADPFSDDYSSFFDFHDRDSASHADVLCDSNPDDYPNELIAGSMESSRSTATEPLSPASPPDVSVTTPDKGICVHCGLWVRATHKRLRCNSGYLHHECGSLLQNLADTTNLKLHNKVLQNMKLKMRSMEADFAEADDMRLAALRAETLESIEAERIEHTAESRCTEAQIDDLRKTHETETEQNDAKLAEAAAEIARLEAALQVALAERERTSDSGVAAQGKEPELKNRLAEMHRQLSEAASEREVAQHSWEEQQGCHEAQKAGLATEAAKRDQMLDVALQSLDRALATVHALEEQQACHEAEKTKLAAEADELLKSHHVRMRSMEAELAAEAAHRNAGLIAVIDQLDENDDENTKLRKQVETLKEELAMKLQPKQLATEQNWVREEEVAALEQYWKTELSEEKEALIIANKEVLVVLDEAAQTEAELRAEIRRRDQMLQAKEIENSELLNAHAQSTIVGNNRYSALKSPVSRSDLKHTVRAGFAADTREVAVPEKRSFSMSPGSRNKVARDQALIDEIKQKKALVHAIKQNSQKKYGTASCRF